MMMKSIYSICLSILHIFFVIIVDAGIPSTVGQALLARDGYIYTMMGETLYNQSLIRLRLPNETCILITDVQTCINTTGCSACQMKQTGQSVCFPSLGSRPIGFANFNSKTLCPWGWVAWVRECGEQKFLSRKEHCSKVFPNYPKVINRNKSCICH